ncbi:MAG: hypothetical protein CVU89_06875 [Firmicutes bacterium HGW-Firmicutes-14]|nr:MAG: hypothetical protein CVU89_06875 [Firmicutes bacterium HGW-Firmicutes-14]
MFENQQMTPAAMTFDCISSTRFLALCDTYGAMQSSSHQLRQAYARMAQDHLSLVDEWYNLAQSKGWHSVPDAGAGSVTQAINRVRNVMSVTSGQTGGTGQPLYYSGQY